MSTDDIIRASELGQYEYCARAWWLARVKGYPSANVSQMRAGLVRHRAHGRAVAGYRRLQWLAWALLFMAVAAFAAFLFFSLGH